MTVKTFYIDWRKCRCFKCDSFLFHREVSDTSDNLVFRNLLCCIINAHFVGRHLYYRCLSETMVKWSDMAACSQKAQQTVWGARNNIHSKWLLRTPRSSNVSSYGSSVEEGQSVSCGKMILHVEWSVCVAVSADVSKCSPGTVASCKLLLHPVHHKPARGCT